MEVFPGIFNMASYVCMCKSYRLLFFGGGVVSLVFFFFFLFLVPNHYKKVLFRILKNLFVAFWGQKWKVNNLATYKSITWPHFCQHFWVDMWPRYWLISYIFCVFQALFFSQNNHSPCRKKNICEKKLKQRQWDKGGQVIDLWWPGYWPYSP